MFNKKVIRLAGAVGFFVVLALAAAAFNLLGQVEMGAGVIALAGLAWVISHVAGQSRLPIPPIRPHCPRRGEAPPLAAHLDDGVDEWA